MREGNVISPSIEVAEELSWRALVLYQVTTVAN